MNKIKKMGIQIGAMAFTCLLFTVFCKMSVMAVELDENNFPNQKFREYLSKGYDRDKNGILDEEEIKSVRSIGISFSETCTSLDGIRFFENLTLIDCDNIKLEQLDLSNFKKLQNVYFQEFDVEKLDLSGCERLLKVDITNSTLKELNLSNCELLQECICKNGNLNRIDTDNCKRMQYLDLSDNQLSQIDLDFPNLDTLFMYRNKLQTIDLTKLPELTDCRLIGNELRELDTTKNPLLDRLYASKNKLEEIDLSKNPDLLDVNLGDNELKKLDVSNLYRLAWLKCENNHITHLDFSKNPVLEQGYYQAVVVSPQNVEFWEDENGRVDLSQISGFDLTKIRSYTNCEIEDGFLMPTTLEKTGSYIYNLEKMSITVNFSVVKHEHTYDRGEVTTEPSCSKEGVLTYRCIGCGEEKSEKIDKLQHSYEKHIKKASLSKEGKIEEKCKYCEKLKKTTKIPKVNKIELSSYEMIYNGKKQKPKVTLKDTAGKEIATFFYSVKESSSAVKVGTYRLNVSLNGFYQGDKSVAYRIVPKGTKIASIKSDKKAFILNWKKQTTQVDGYEIQYSTSEKFATSSTKKLSIKKDSTVTKKVKNLKAKKKYYVRIRTYKKVNGKTYYSDWSKTKSVVTK